MKMEMGQLQANTLARIGVLSFKLFLRGLAFQRTNIGVGGRGGLM